MSFENHKWSEIHVCTRSDLTGSKIQCPQTPYRVCCHAQSHCPPKFSISIIRWGWYHTSSDEKLYFTIAVWQKQGWTGKVETCHITASETWWEFTGNSLTYCDLSRKLKITQMKLNLNILNVPSWSLSCAEKNVWILVLKLRECLHIPIRGVECY